MVDVVTVPSHLAVPEVHTYVTVEAARDLAREDTPAPEPVDALGRWTRFSSSTSWSAQVESSDVPRPMARTSTRSPHHWWWRPSSDPGRAHADSRRSPGRRHVRRPGTPPAVTPAT